MTRRCGPARRDVHFGIPFLSLSGSHYEMGFQYGTLLQAELRQAVPVLFRTRNAFLNLAPVPLRPFVGLFLSVRTALEKIRIPKKYRDEIRGASDGSGILFRTLLTISTFAEVLMNIGCTSVLSRTRNGILHARNLDFAPLDLGKYPAVVTYSPEGTDASYTLAGFIGYLPGLTGFNSSGLSFSVNEVSVPPEFFKGRRDMILGYQVRDLLETAQTLSDCSNTLRVYRGGQGWTLAIGSARENAGMICDITPAGVVTHPMGAGKNMFALNDYFGEKNRTAFEPVTRSGHGINIARRDRAKKTAGTIHDARSALRFLSDTRFYNHPEAVGESTINNYKTLQSVVMDAARGELYLSSAPGYAGSAKVIRHAVRTGQSSLYRKPDAFLKKPDIRKLTDWLTLLYCNPDTAYKKALKDKFLLPYQMEALMFLSRSFRKYPLIPSKLLAPVRRLRKLYPRSAAPVFWEAELMRKSKKYPEAVNLYRTSLDQPILFSSDELFSRTGLAVCLAKLNRSAEASSEARKALALVPSGRPDGLERRISTVLNSLARSLKIT